VTSAVALNGSGFGGRTRGSSFALDGTRMTGKIAVLPVRTGDVAVAVPAGTITAVPKLKGPGIPPPFSEVSVTVYDSMMTLSSALVPVTVGFLRLFRRVTHTWVEVPVSIEELTLAVSVPALSENPSIDRKMNAEPL
jgi:hypothetical protein